MEYQRFERLKAEIATSTASQVLNLERLIQNVVLQQVAAIALARRSNATVVTRTCPHCTNHHVILHGQERQRQAAVQVPRGGRTYNVLNGTSMARARKPEKWRQYLAT